jgi:hypothetical protein
MIDDNELLRQLLSNMVIEHPLPWKVEQDWTWEVYDASGKLVVKLGSYDAATTLLEKAESARKRIDSALDGLGLDEPENL